MSAEVYDRAHELARTLKHSREYREYQQALKALKANEKAWNMLTDFRQKWLKLEAASLAGEEVDSENVEELQNQQRVLSSHTELTRFLEAEARLGKILEDIQRILAQVLDLDSGVGTPGS